MKLKIGYKITVQLPHFHMNIWDLHGEIPGRTILGEVYPVGAPNKTLISGHCSLPIRIISREGKVSQILYLGLSFNLMKC